MSTNPADCLGPKALYGHAIHLSDREERRLKDSGASLIHCPTSNTFIGSGLFDLLGRAGDGHKLGLASDIGGGSSFSMLRTMASAYEIGQLQGNAIHPAQLICSPPGQRRRHSGWKRESAALR